MDQGLNTNWRTGSVNTNWVPGPVNTNWGPVPVNTNWGPGPGSRPGVKQRARAGKYKYPKIKCKGRSSYFHKNQKKNFSGISFQKFLIFPVWAFS